MYGKDAYKGKFKPLNPEKYKGNVNNIVARSSWETKAFIWCDTNPNVVKWGSEEIVIPYISPLDGEFHRYFVDLYMEIKDVNGNRKKFLVEIKPKRFTQKPAVPKRKTKRFLQEAMQYAVNEAKWQAAEKVCKKNGMEFIILTEDQLMV